MTRQIDVLVPESGFDSRRAQVARWLKQPGQRVDKNEPLLEIETDKANVEVAAPASGILAAIVRVVGDLVGDGDRLGVLDLEEILAAPAAGEHEHERARLAVEPAADLAAKLSPGIRRLLREHQLAAHEVAVAGASLTREDVLAHVAHVERVRRSPIPAAPPSSRLVPHPPLRRQAAASMMQTFARSGPQVTAVFEADLERVLAHRDARHAASPAPLSLTTYVVVAAARALAAVPEVNSRWHDSGLEIFDDANLGVVVALGAGGVIVPVLRRAQTLSLVEVAVALAEIKSRAIAGRLTPDDTRGGTFTISNHGTSGSLIATPILYGSQSAILGVGARRRIAVPFMRDGREVIEARSRVFVTLTIDHRALDAHHTNAFLSRFVNVLETWDET